MKKKLLLVLFVLFSPFLVNLDSANILAGSKRVELKDIPKEELELQGDSPKFFDNHVKQPLKVIEDKKGRRVKIQFKEGGYAYCYYPCAADTRKSEGKDYLILSTTSGKPILFRSLSRKTEKVNDTIVIKPNGFRWQQENLK